MNFSQRNLIILGVIAVIVIAGALALSMYMSGNHDGGYQLAANTAPPAKPAQSGAPQLGRMQLQAQYAGPLRDTLIQRWRDPVDGTICYIYLPIIVRHGDGANGLVQYGANSIGSISCLRPQ